jgi:hypothetical protein
MTEKWTVPLPKGQKQGQGEKRANDNNHSNDNTTGKISAAVIKKIRAEGEIPLLVDDELLAGNFRQDIARLEQHLKDTNFLDPTLGVHEQLHSRDPMLLVLESPSKAVILGDDTPSTVIDELVKSGDAAFRRSCGSAYEDFEMIQYAVETCLASKDFHAKQMMFLGMMAIDRGLHDQFLASYPNQDGEIRESARFEPYMKNVVRPQLDEACNTMYVNVPVPTRFNVDELLRKFLSKCVGGYQG